MTATDSENSSEAPVHILPMANPHHENKEDPVPDPVDDAVVPHPDPAEVLRPPQLLRGGQPRLSLQVAGLREDALLDFSGELPDRIRLPGLEADLVGLGIRTRARPSVA